MNALALAAERAMTVAMRSVALALAVAALAVGCGSPVHSPSSEARLQTVVTIPAVRMWLEGILGDLGDVRLLLPPGASPHVWQPSAGDMRALSDADFAVVAGGGLEPWAHELLVAASTDRVDFSLVDRLIASGLLDVSREALGDHDDDHQHGHVFDAHVWQSPTFARALCREIAGELARLAPDHAAEITQREASFEATQIDAALAACERLRPILSTLRVVQFHRSWENLARDAGYTVAGTIEPTPGVEPSPRVMRELIDLVEFEDANVVIAEPQLNAAAARRLAEAANLPLVTLDPYGRPDESYAEFIDRNLEALAAAAGAEAP